MSTGPSSGRGIFSIGARAPLEIRLACALLVAGALAFLLVGALRLPSAQGSTEGLLLPPLLQLVVAIGIAGGVLRGIRSARLVAVGFVLLVGLLHATIALQGIEVWVRIASGLIAASQVYVAVLLNTKPALEFAGGGRR
jgi:hypothetical protein